MNRSTSIDNEWTTFGRDLMVSLTEIPKGQWTTHLCRQIRDAIRGGALRPGVRLPSTRALAKDLRLSRGVVVNVYEQLTAEGYLKPSAGSATRVAHEFLLKTGSEPVCIHRIGPFVEHNPGLPDPGQFPRTDWLRAYRTALKKLSDTDLCYGDPQGFEPLRTELSDYLGRVRGVIAKPEQLLVISGYAQGVAVVAQILLGCGIDAVAVEEPGSTGIRHQLVDWGVTTPPVAVDERGLSVLALRATGARAVLTTPAHHYPTGFVLAPDRRHQLLNWVHEGPHYIVEDDYDAEFRYDHAPISSLQPLAPERIITGSSVSKTLTPSLRLGWLVLPPQLIEQAVRVKISMDLGTPTPSQAAFTEFLRTGAFDRHLRRSRRHYRIRRERIAERLLQFLNPSVLTGTEAGLNICIRIDKHVDDQAISDELRSIGSCCRPLSHYYQHEPQRGLILDVATTQSTHLDHLQRLLTSATRQSH
ncbi:MAG: PLP-dependent aminotransferase family protein [bacterium]|nr:PLP-dependent aminotransferase family protein [bacterium]